MKNVLGQFFAATDPASYNINDWNFWSLPDWLGRKTTSGENVTPERAVTLPAYYAAIRCISEDVAKLPLIVYRRSGDRGKERATDYPLYNILKFSPNDFIGSMAWREVMQAWALGWGNGYSEIERSGSGAALSLHPIHPSRVTVKVREDGSVWYAIKNKDTSITPIEAENMFHLHGMGGDGLSGWSTLRLAAESVGLGLALQKFGAAFFGNGASLGGVLETPGVLKPEAKNYLRQSWEEIHKGADNAGKIAILEQGLKFSKISIPPDEAQFLEGRKFQVEDICRWFRIPPHKLQHLERATFSNIEQQAIEYVTDCLHSWFERWEEEIQRKLIPEGDRDEYFAEHLVGALMRGDSAARATFYSQMINTGVMSPNDARELENWNPIGPEGDKHYIQGAMVSLETAAAPPDPEPPAVDPTKQPTPPPDPESPTSTPRAGGDPAKYAVGDKVVALVDHMPGMKGMRGEVSIVRTSPPYYGVTFDGENSVHKWLAQDEVAAADTDTMGAALPAKASAEQYRRMFDDAATRVMRKYAMAVERSALKFKANPTQFVEWHGKFIAEIQENIFDGFCPIVQTVTGMMGLDMAGQLAALRLAGRAHCDGMAQAMTAPVTLAEVAKGSTQPERWEKVTAQSLSQAMMNLFKES